MDVQELRNKLATTEKRIAGMPTWRLALYGAIGLFALVYLGWSLFHRPSPSVGSVVSVPPAIKVEKVAGPVMKKPLMIVPPAAVEREFPQLGPVAPSKPVIDTAKIPKTNNGGSTVTFMNVSTGRAETKFIPAPSPWFAFQSGSIVGARYEIGTEGSRVHVYYKRDIFRVKDIYAVAEVGGSIPVGVGKGELYAGGGAEYRFGR
jgi:hypothetical protein